MKTAYAITTILFAASLAILATGCSSNTSSSEGYSETISLSEFQEYAPEVNPPSGAQESAAEVAEESIDASADTTSAIKEKDAEANDAEAGGAKGIDKTDKEEKEPVRDLRITRRDIGKLKEIFNDSNEYQLRHARRMGIDPITDVHSLYNTKRPLVMVETNDDFKVDELTHSFPFLVPEASQLLHDIGRAFRDSVAARKGGNYRIIVTSVLRTPVTVKKLRRVNRNATEQSTHQYATTFDITYNRFDCVSGADKTDFTDLKATLAEVIRDLHAQGRCMVKYEIKSPCFHITVVN